MYVYNQMLNSSDMLCIAKTLTKCVVKCLCVHLLVCLRMCIRIYIYRYTCMYIHTYAYVYIQTKEMLQLKRELLESRERCSSLEQDIKDAKLERDTVHRAIKTSEKCEQEVSMRLCAR